jgi:hypothetical protein
MAPGTVHRILVRRGLNRLRDIDPPTGESARVRGFLDVVGLEPARDVVVGQEVPRGFVL